MSEAYGVQGTQGIPPDWLTSSARDYSYKDTGTLWQGSRAGVHWSLCDWILATRLHKVVSLEKYSGQRGKQYKHIIFFFFFFNIFQLICTMARCHLHFTLLICHHHQSPLMFFSSIFTNLSTKRELLNHIIAQFASLLATN